tara:strand:- start:346 stop:633 length:288 start_codon:yes stop_codon:yes gene_type:complete
MGLAKEHALALLEKCDCDKGEIETSPLSLSDRPSKSRPLEIGYNGQDYVGWYAPIDGDKIHVVLFCADESAYCAETIEASEHILKTTVGKMVKSL